jgi:hypothetical protein
LGQIEGWKLMVLIWTLGTPEIRSSGVALSMDFSVGGGLSHLPRGPGFRAW